MLQWYISTVTIPKAVLLIIHLTKNSMKSLMKLTSLLLVETLSHSDCIMVYVSNVSCTNKVVIANLSQWQLIERCIVTKLNVMLPAISLYDAFQKFNR